MLGVSASGKGFTTRQASGVYVVTVTLGFGFPHSIMTIADDGEDEYISVTVATTNGLKEQESIDFLEHKMKNDPEFSYDKTVQVHDSVSILGESSKRQKENLDDLLLSRLRQYEEAKQDDDLSDPSHILEELKEMVVDMGLKIKSKALNALRDDVEEINFRVKGANQRTRRSLEIFGLDKQSRDP
ncbi:hypothetical protein Tco_1211810 [Tanacetum coccineum]